LPFKVLIVAGLPHNGKSSENKRRRLSAQLAGLWIPVLGIAALRRMIGASTAVEA